MINPLLIILSLPSLVYLVVFRRGGGAWRAGLARLGWQWTQPVYLLWSPGILLILGALGWTGLRVEEIFFRGWPGGWMRHQSRSILPGWVVHSLTNTLSALAFMT